MAVSAVTFSPDGQWLAVCGSDRAVSLWEVGKGLRTLTGHKETVKSLAFGSDGKTLASGTWGGEIRLWDLPSGKLQQALKAHVREVNSVAFSPVGKTLAS